MQNNKTTICGAVAAFFGGVAGYLVATTPVDKYLAWKLTLGGIAAGAKMLRDYFAADRP